MPHHFESLDAPDLPKKSKFNRFGTDDIPDEDEKDVTQDKLVKTTTRPVKGLPNSSKIIDNLDDNEPTPRIDFVNKSYIQGKQV